MNKGRGTYRVSTPVLADPPVPEVEHIQLKSEIERRVEGVEKLAEVGRLPGS